MKKLIALSILVVTLAGCTQMDWFLGLDDKGQKKEGTAPVDYATQILNGLGPIGVAGSTLLGMGATAYVGRKKGQDPLKAVIAAVEAHKDDLSDKDKAALVETLKKKIPNKYHKLIDNIKGNL